MAGVFSDQAIEEIKRRTSLVQVIGEYVQLKKAGRSHKGLCPFHGEKTPSFHVHESEGYFYCFGCQAKGDAISFLREHVGYTFPEAIRLLGERAGVELVEDDYDPQAAARRREKREDKVRFADTNALAQDFFRRQLGDEAYAYLIDQRGLTQETIEHFQLGFAPDDWDQLSRDLARAGFQAVRDAQSLGLIGQRREGGSGHYDKFRNRVMFPVFGPLRGEVIGFAGRTLAKDKETPKYVNSSESELFTKGNTLYGLYLAKHAIKTKGRAIVVEGQVDVLTMAQAGFDETVAPMGTALTEEQCRLLKRFGGNAVLIYDADGAGQAAAMKAVPLLLFEGVTGRVVQLPAGDDPDTFVRTCGAEALEQLIDESRPLFDAYLHAALETYDGSIPGRTAVLETLRPVFALLSKDEQAQYRRVVAQQLGILESDLRGWGGGQRYEESYGPAPQQTQQGGRRAPLRERQMLWLLLNFPNYLPFFAAENGAGYMTHPGVRNVAEAAIRTFESKGRLDVVALMQDLTESGMERLSHAVAKLIADDEPVLRAEPERAFVDVLKALKTTAKKAERKRRIREGLHRLDEQEQLAFVHSELAGK